MDTAFLTVQEAAARSGIHRDTIYEWISTAKIPAFGRGRAIRVRLADVLCPYTNRRLRALRERNAKLRSDTLVSDSRLGPPAFPTPTDACEQHEPHGHGHEAAPARDTVE